MSATQPGGPNPAFNVPRSARRPLGHAEGQVSLSKARARRKWAFRSSGLLVLTGAVLLLAMVWWRDSFVIEKYLEMAREDAAELQREIDETGLLPAWPELTYCDLPERDSTTQPASLRKKYGFVYMAGKNRNHNVNLYLQRTGKPVVAAASGPVPLVLQSNGRVVILCEGDKVRTIWMTITEYDEVKKAEQEGMAELMRPDSAAGGGPGR